MSAMIMPILMSLMLSQSSPIDVSNSIIDLNPHVSQKRANFLGRIIYKEASRFNIDPKIITAILRQESNFEPNQKVCYVVHRNKACWDTCDFGISQINAAWAKRWHLDTEELINNDAFNIHIAARVLSIIQKQFGDEENWYSRFNTSGPKRAIYEMSIKSYLAELE